MAGVGSRRRTLMADIPNVRLKISNRPENVLLVREILTGVAEGVDLDRTEGNDIRTAVTEACNNVVLHAYGGAEGPLEMEVFTGPRAIEVVVRDHGTGMRPHIRTAEETALGIGLHVIQALAPRVEFSDVAGGGTEVRMEFATSPIRTFEPVREDRMEPPAIARAELTTTVGATIAPTSLARTVLPRLLSVLATRAHFSTDRISDAQLVADSLVAHAPVSIGSGHFGIAVCVEPRTLELRVGPLGSGGARRLILDSALDGLGAVIEKLTDEHRVAAVGSSEVLALRLVDGR
jgi:anti-sigma regulatory factor (Ser/Thr protein kinase)